MHLYSAVLKSS